jgi:predicted transcriptional regulator
MAGGYVPAGWPPMVRAPGAADWELTASAFLLDCCPPEFRLYPVLRRHPVVLARFAVRSVEAQAKAVEAGLAEARTDLGRFVPLEVVEQAIDAWQRQGALLLRTRRAVDLVERALRGEDFVPTM